MHRCIKAGVELCSAEGTFYGHLIYGRCGFIKESKHEWTGFVSERNDDGTGGIHTAMSKKQHQNMKQRLEQTYVTIGCVANHASTQAFCLVAQDQLECLISHACSVYSKISKDVKWTKTGFLQKYDQALLAVLIFSMKHISFVKLCLEMQDKESDKQDQGLLVVLAQLCAARDKTNMPCSDVATATLSIL
jgi:hypothetical protein